MSILNSAAVGLRLRPGVWLAGGLVLAFLLLFLVLPVARVFFTAFVEADGSLTIGHFEAFFAQGLMREAFFNSLYVAVMSAVFASLIAVPLAYFTVRFQFRGAILIQTRHRIQQTKRIGVARPGIKRSGGPGLDDLASIHHVHPMRIAGNNPEVMRDDDQRDPHLPAQIPHQRQHLRLDRHVQRGCRLIRQNEFRIT